MKAIHIQWDTDGDSELLEQLPTEVELPPTLQDVDSVSDYLSDTYGFCHFGFELVKETL